MSSVPPIRKEDLVLLRRSGIFAGISLMITTAIFFSGQYLAQFSENDLRIARANLEQRRTAVEQIEQEEATIVQYIDQYRSLADEGLFVQEDRLGVMEVITETRTKNQLFATEILISEQMETELEYDVNILEPGEPVALQTTAISLNLPLLHEEDLTRMLDGILSTPGLMQTESCVVTLNAIGVSFYNMGENLRAACVLLWYHFNLTPGANEE